MAGVRLRTSYLTTSVQILTTALAGGSGGCASRAHQTVLAATTATVAAALGFPRQQRGAYFIQQSLFKHLRRALLLLGLQMPVVWLVGALPRLRLFWATLTKATGEVFFHPVTGELVPDVRVTAVQVRRLGSIPTVLAQVLDPANVLLGPSAAEATDRLAALGRGLAREVASRLRTHRTWQRYWVTWGQVWALGGAARGALRQPRARSIKRRLAKRLVRTTQYRFWPR